MLGSVGVKGLPAYIHQRPRQVFSAGTGVEVERTAGSASILSGSWDGIPSNHTQPGGVSGKPGRLAGNRCHAPVVVHVRGGVDMSLYGLHHRPAPY